MEEVLRCIEAGKAKNPSIALRNEDRLFASGMAKHGNRVARIKPGEGSVNHPRIESRAGLKLVRPHGTDDQAHACMVQPSTPIAACRNASDRVGWG